VLNANRNQTVALKKTQNVDVIAHMANDCLYSIITSALGAQEHMDMSSLIKLLSRHLFYDDNVK
jgi:hypothetical protein